MYSRRNKLALWYDIFCFFGEKWLAIVHHSKSPICNRRSGSGCKLVAQKRKFYSNFCALAYCSASNMPKTFVLRGISAFFETFQNYSLQPFCNTLQVDLIPTREPNPFMPSVWCQNMPKTTALGRFLMLLSLDFNESENFCRHLVVTGSVMVYIGLLLWYNHLLKMEDKYLPSKECPHPSDSSKVYFETS